MRLRNRDITTYTNNYIQQFINNVKNQEIPKSEEDTIIWINNNIDFLVETRDTIIRKKNQVLGKRSRVSQLSTQTEKRPRIESNEQSVQSSVPPSSLVSSVPSLVSSVPSSVPSLVSSVPSSSLVSSVPSLVSSVPSLVSSVPSLVSSVPSSSSSSSSSSVLQDESKKSVNEMNKTQNFIEKIKQYPKNLNFTNLEDTISNFISSDSLMKFNIGKNLIKTNDLMKTPIRLCFLKLYLIYKQSSDDNKVVIREIMGDTWTEFQRISSGVNEFVKIFGTKYSLFFLAKITNRDLKNRTVTVMKNIKKWWKNEDKNNYRVNGDSEKLYNSVILNESSAVIIFKQICLGKV